MLIEDIQVWIITRWLRYRGAIGSNKELEHTKTTFSIKRNAINQIKQTLRRSLSDPLNARFQEDQSYIEIL